MFTLLDEATHLRSAPAPTCDMDERGNALQDRVALFCASGRRQVAQGPTLSPERVHDYIETEGAMDASP